MPVARLVTCWQEVESVSVACQTSRSGCPGDGPVAVRLELRQPHLQRGVAWVGPHRRRRVRLRVHIGERWMCVSEDVAPVRPYRTVCAYRAIVPGHVDPLLLQVLHKRLHRLPHCDVCRAWLPCRQALSAAFGVLTGDAPTGVVDALAARIWSTRRWAHQPKIWRMRTTGGRSVDTCLNSNAGSTSGCSAAAMHQRGGAVSEKGSQNGSETAGGVGWGGRALIRQRTGARPNGRDALPAHGKAGTALVPDTVVRAGSALRLQRLCCRSSSLLKLGRRRQRERLGRRRRRYWRWCRCGSGRWCRCGSCCALA